MHKLMYFLTGNAEGFKIPEKTVLQRCNISESGYKRARKKLTAMGWISYKPGQYIQVNYNNIFKDLKYKPAGCSQEPYGDEGTDTEMAPSNPQEGSSGDKEVPQSFENGFPENTYNNINNIEQKKENEEIKDKGSRCEDTSSASATAAAPSASSQPLRPYSYKDKKVAERKLQNKYDEAYTLMALSYDLDSKEEIKKMEQSDEYKEFLRKVAEWRQEFIDTYGYYPTLKTPRWI